MITPKMFAPKAANVAKIKSFSMSSSFWINPNYVPVRRFSINLQQELINQLSREESFATTIPSMVIVEDGTRIIFLVDRVLSNLIYSIKSPMSFALLDEFGGL